MSSSLGAPQTQPSSGLRCTHSLALMNFTLKAGDLHKGLARDPFRDSRQLARLSTQLSISDSTYILAYTSVYTRLRTTHIDTNFCPFAYTPSTFRSPPHALILFTHIYRHAHIRTGCLQHRMLIFCPCHSPSAVVNPYSCTVDDPTTVQSCLPSCLHITAVLPFDHPYSMSST